MTYASFIRICRAIEDLHSEIAAVAPDCKLFAITVDDGRGGDAFKHHLAQAMRGMTFTDLPNARVPEKRLTLHGVRVEFRG